MSVLANPVKPEVRVYCFPPKMASCKKIKCEDENHGFLEELIEKFAFVERSGKPLCLVCNTVLNYFRVSNLRRHYDINHGHFHFEYPTESEIPSHKIKSLKSSAQCQMTILTAFRKKQMLPLWLAMP